MFADEVPTFRRLLDLLGGSLVEAQIYAVTGRQDEARRRLDRLEWLPVEQLPDACFAPLNIAVIHAALGNADQALERLETLVAQRCAALVVAMQVGLLDPLGDDPRPSRLYPSGAPRPVPQCKAVVCLAEIGILPLRMSKTDAGQVLGVERGLFGAPEAYLWPRGRGVGFGGGR